MKTRKRHMEDRSVDRSDPYPELGYREFRTALEILEEATPSTRAMKAIEVAENGQGWAEHLIEGLKEAIPVSHPLACRKGCSFCCILQVGAKIPEVLRIAAYLKAMLSAEELATVRARLDEHHAFVQSLPPESRAEPHRQCPLLVDDCCSIYPVRPLNCRGWNSTDVKPCEEYFHNPGTSAKVKPWIPQFMTTSMIQAGMQAATRHSGLEYRTVELVSALRIALDIPDAAERWMNGEPVFQEAELILTRPDMDVVDCPDHILNKLVDRARSDPRLPILS